MTPLGSHDTAPNETAELPVMRRLLLTNSMLNLTKFIVHCLTRL
jgi:hypothetical protein